MKKLILVSIVSLLLSSTYANAEWVKPTRSACTSNGGKLENGICKANWQIGKVQKISVGLQELDCPLSMSLEG